jgi:ATP-dependent Clp protease ATP-binding subunit ClpA
VLLHGYIGYDDEKNLVNIIRKKPYCVVLFDEIEKAHEDVLNLLLQILEDGKLTNSNGVTANFQETFVILTSNLGANIMEGKGKIGFQNNSERFAKNEVIEEVKRFLKPELVNRIDEVIVFNHLNEKDIYTILNNEIDQLKDVMEKKNILFDVSKEFKKYMVGKCNYFQYGARTVRREMERDVEDFIVDKLINNEIKTDEKILLDVYDNKKRIIKLKS